VSKGARAGLFCDAAQTEVATVSLQWFTVHLSKKEGAQCKLSPKAWTARLCAMDRVWYEGARVECPEKATLVYNLGKHVDHNYYACCVGPEVKFKGSTALTLTASSLRVYTETLARVGDDYMSWDDSDTHPRSPEARGAE
jgi:hypothetical protein